MLIDKYVRQIRFWLPGPRGRIAAEEVRATLGEMITDRKQQLGRPLDEQEVTEVIREFGSPQVIASRYSMSRPLVSAALMPAYTRVLGIAATGAFVVQLAMAAAATTSGGDVGLAFATTANRIVTGLLWSFTSVTLVFAALTRIYGPATSNTATNHEC